MYQDISGRVAMITGASRGIGEACAHALAQEGCKLALMARSRDELAAVAAHCRSAGAAGVLELPVDVTDDGALAAAVEQCIVEHGGLNILVNNAGVFWAGSAESLELEKFDAMLDVNLRAVIHLTRLALPHLIEGYQRARHGAVINIASMSSVNTYARGSGYCASKFGVLGFAGGLFEDVRAAGIKVSSILPSWVNTEMVEWTGLDGTMMIQPEEIAELARLCARWPDNSCPQELHVNVQRIPDKKQR